MRTFSLASAVTAVAVASSLALAAPATAMDATAVSGDNSTCGTVDWTAETNMNLTLEDYSNSGYTKVVSSNVGDTEGIFMLTHFTLGAIKGTDENGAITYTDGANTTQVWRPGVATKQALQDAKFTFTLPEGAESASIAEVQTKDNDLNAYVQGWGGEWAEYTWDSIDTTSAHDNGDGTWTVDLGDMDADTGVMFQFNVSYPDGTNLANDFIGTAHLTASTGEQCLSSIPVTGSSSSTDSLGWLGFLAGGLALGGVIAVALTNLLRSLGIIA